MPLDNFITRPDFSRQIKQYSSTTANLSGSTKVAEDLFVKNIEIDTANPQIGNVLVYDGTKFLPAPYDAYGEVILNGMILSYQSGLTYNISSGQYRMFGATYIYTGGTVIINSGNSLYSRFDVVYVTGDTLSLAFVLSGTPSPTPTVPSLVQNQLQVGIISVGANFTGGTGTTIIQVTSDTVFEFYDGSTGIQRAGALGAEAIGNFSFALSRNSKSYGEDSVSLGLGTQASGNSQTVVGQYNTTNTDDYFIVGNGASSGSRSNAFRITTGGSAYVTNKLFVTNYEIETTGASTNQALVFDGTKFKPQTVTGSSSGSTSGNFLPLSGGTLTGDLTIKQDKKLVIVNSGNSIGGSWTAASISFYDNNPSFNKNINLIPVVNPAFDSNILIQPSAANNYIPVGPNPSLYPNQLYVTDGQYGFTFSGITSLPYLANTGGTVNGNVLINGGLSAYSINLYNSNNSNFNNKIDAFDTTMTFYDDNGNQFFQIDSSSITIGPTSTVAGILSSSLSAPRLFTLPDKNGTFAMLDDIVSGSGGGITGLTSAGTGNIQILSSITNNRLVYKTISAGTGVAITESNGTLIFSRSNTYFTTGITTASKSVNLALNYLYDNIILTSSTSTETITAFTSDLSISSYTPSIRFFAQTGLTVTFQNSTTLKTEGGLDAVIVGSNYDSITFEYNTATTKFYQTNINNYI
jgi:hypothetical protein